MAEHFVMRFERTIDGVDHEIVIGGVARLYGDGYDEPLETIVEFDAEVFADGEPKITPAQACDLYEGDVYNDWHHNISPDDGY